MRAGGRVKQLHAKSLGDLTRWRAREVLAVTSTALDNGSNVSGYAFYRLEPLPAPVTAFLQPTVWERGEQEAAGGEDRVRGPPGGRRDATTIERAQQRSWNRCRPTGASLVDVTGSSPHRERGDAASARPVTPREGFGGELPAGLEERRYGARQLDVSGPHGRPPDTGPRRTVRTIRTQRRAFWCARGAQRA